MHEMATLAKSDFMRALQEPQRKVKPIREVKALEYVLLSKQACMSSTS